MPLTDTFEETIERAVFNKKAGLTSYSLHQVLTGPPLSGKTTMAYEYAERLAEEGLAEDKPAVQIMSEDIFNQSAMNKARLASSGGVLIIDELHAISEPGIVSSLLMELFEKWPCKAIVITGPTDKTKRMIQANPVLIERFTSWSETERRFTEEEYTAYNRVSSAERKQKRRQQKAAAIQKEKEVRDKKFSDVTLRRQIKPMSNIRIQKKGNKP